MPSSTVIRLRRSLATARRRYVAHPTRAGLTAYLRAKARLGRWDDRYCAYYHVPRPTSPRVRAFITRAYARGLVPTATTNGVHARGSYHYLRRAADVGLRSGEIGTRRGLQRMQSFQLAEFHRRATTRPVELLGPINDKCILAGRVTTLAEHSPLEDAHDNHVHGAF